MSSRTQYYLDVAMENNKKLRAENAKLKADIAEMKALVYEEAAGIVHQVFSDAQWVCDITLDAMQALEDRASQIRSGKDDK